MEILFGCGGRVKKRLGARGCGSGLGLLIWSRAWTDHNKGNKWSIRGVLAGDREGLERAERGRMPFGVSPIALLSLTPLLINASLAFGSPRGRRPIVSKLHLPVFNSSGEGGISSGIRGEKICFTSSLIVRNTGRPSFSSAMKKNEWT